MRRTLTPGSSLETIRRQAKRWLRALRAGDAAARARFERIHPRPAVEPALRDVQHALALEYGFAGWTALRDAVAAQRAAALPADRDAAVTALLDAALRGDPVRVAALLDADPGIIDARGFLPGHHGARTALHFATNAPHEAVIELLLARGADPNVRDEGDNAMPLHFAAEKGHAGIVRRLLEHGADPDGAGDVHELGVIGWATVFARAPDPGIVRLLLAHGARHTIASAVVTGDAAAIRAVVTATPGELDRAMDGTNHHRRPLHLAVVKRQPAALAALLELGADVEAEDAAGLTALDQAALEGEPGLADALIAHGARVRLPAAIALGRHDDVERLLREEPHALRPGGRHDRLIVRAAATAPGRVIEALLRAGASVHVQDDPRTAVDGTHGYTPLHAAAFHGNIDAVRVLLRHGANATVRESRYWGTPAGWADYAGHTTARDLILDGPIDPFDAVAFDRTDRFAEIVARDPLALERPLRDCVPGGTSPPAWLDGDWTPLAYAAAHGKAGAEHVLRGLGAGRTPVEPSFDERVADFLRLACPDWRVGGGQRETGMLDAGRLLARVPDIARADICTAAVCGEVEFVRRLLDADPAAASRPAGPRTWPPILYLCAARLPGTAWSDRAPDVLRLLLERGADPNAFYHGGNVDIRYTALTCVLGRGEERGSTHPRARALAALLLEHGADPHDTQVLYNVFGEHASRPLLDDDIIWLLELLRTHSLRRGRAADWADPAWPMFELRGAASLGDGERRHSGARLLLEAAVARNLTGLAAWLLEHGAGPDTAPGTLWARPERTLYQEAVVRGHTALAELLVRHGATPAPLPASDRDPALDASLAGDAPRVHILLGADATGAGARRALFAAVDRDRDDAVGLLLDAGAPADVDDPAGLYRPLHAAAYAGAERAARVLIERGAEIDPRDGRYGATPLGWAVWAGQRGMIALLAPHSRDVWSLTATGQTERLRVVLSDEPALAGAVAPGGRTPLMMLPDDEAAAIEVVAVLLRHGADPAARDARGRSAADIAVRRGLDAAAAALRARGG